MQVRRPIQVRRARRDAGFVVRPQKVWLTSCLGAVRRHRASTFPDTTQVLFYEMMHDLGLIDEVPPWYSPAKPRPVYQSDDVQAYWDVTVFADHEEVRCNRVDARMVNYKTKWVITFEMSCPWVNNREKKSEEKTVKCATLRWQLKQQFPSYEMKQHNNIIDALGSSHGRWTLRWRRLWSAEVKRCWKECKGTLNYPNIFYLICNLRDDWLSVSNDFFSNLA